MTIKDFEYFRAVYQDRSIKKAADKLFISTQGLSQKIKNIELQLDTILFVRTGKELIPTIAADKLINRANIILKEFQSIESDFKSGNTEKKVVVTVAVTYGTVQYLTFEFVQEFYQKYPGIQLNIVEMSEQEIYQQMEKNYIEIALVAGPVDYSAYDAEFCFSWKHCLLIHKNHPLANKDRVAYKDLEHVPLALKGRHYIMFPQNISQFLKRNVNPEFYLETTSEYLIHTAADCGQAVGISLDFLVQQDVYQNIVVKYFEDEACTKEIYVISRKGIALSIEAILFKEFLQHWQAKKY